MKILLRLSAPVTAAAMLFLYSCALPADQSRANAKSAEALPGLACSDIKIEVPSGETIYDYIDNGSHYFCTISFTADSLYSWSYVKDSSQANWYSLVDVTAAAFKDIDSAKTEASEYDLDMTDGSKKHETVFFIKPINEEPKFRSRTYTCFSGDNHFENFDIHTVNIPTYSIEVSKKMVAMIKERLRK